MYGVRKNLYQREYTLHDVICASTELCKHKNIKEETSVNFFGKNYDIIVGPERDHISLDSQISDIHNVFFHNTYYQSIVSFD